MVPLNLRVDAKRKYDNVIIKFMAADGWLEKNNFNIGLCWPHTQWYNHNSCPLCC